MNYAEKATAKAKRAKAAWIALGVGVFLFFAGFLAGGIYIIGGIGFGGMLILWTIHGLVSKPAINLNEGSIEVKGWWDPVANIDIKWFPSNNIELKWDNIASARITTDAVGNKVIWLTDKLGKDRGVESTRYESSEEIEAFIQKKLTEKGIEVAAVTLPAPTPKS